MIGEAGEVAGTVPVAVRARVRVSATLAVRISDEAVLADAFIASGRVDALGGCVAGV